MKALKFIYAFYWIIFFTAVILILSYSLGDWLQAQVYIKEHGVVSKKMPVCIPLPFFIVIPTLTLFIIGIFFWTRNIKAGIIDAKKVFRSNYIDLTLIGIFIILPFILIDIQMIRVLVKLFIKYYFST